MSRILIIDDDMAICRTLDLHLGSQGHEVQVARTFEHGLSGARLRSRGR